MSRLAVREEDDRLALVGGGQYAFGFGDDAEQFDGEDFDDVFDGEHFLLLHALGVVAGDDEVLFDGVFAQFGAARFAGEDAEDAIGVAHGGDFGVGGDDGFVSVVERHQRALFDAGGAVADDVFEVHRLEVVDDFADAFFGEGVFVAGLRGGQDVEVFDALVFDERLFQAGFAVDDVDEVVNDAAFDAHDEVEVAQADVEVDDAGFQPFQGESAGDAGAGRGFPYSAFA